jgi:hypothetical protein
MSGINVRDDATPPFGGQSMQSFLDKMGACFNNWSTTDSILNQGILLSKTRFSTNSRHLSFLKRASQRADRVGPYTMLCHVRFERDMKVKGKTVYLIRGGLIVSSKSNICKFLGSNFHTKIGTRPPKQLSQSGVYWENLNGPATDERCLGYPSYPHPYVDIDISLPQESKIDFDDVYKHVHGGIEKLTSSFLTSGVPPVNAYAFAIFYNHRSKTAKGQLCKKFSFHIHWYQLVCGTLDALRRRVARVSPPLPIEGDGGGLVESATLPLFDPSVYSPSQLFRLPFCGKGDDPAAALLPIRAIKNAAGLWAPEVDDLQVTSMAEWISRSCTHTTNPLTYVMVEEQDHPLPPTFEQLPPVRQAAGQPRVSFTDERDWMEFMGPVTDKFILPNYVSYRQTQALKKGASAVLLPDINAIEIRSRVRLPNYPCTFQIEPVGDCFCEYDEGATRYCHKEARNCVSYLVDYYKGRIAQMCKACKKPRGLHWYSFIQVPSLKFNIIPSDETNNTTSEYVDCSDQSKVMEFFTKFFSEVILTCLDSKKVMVYDKARGIWFDGSHASFLVAQLQRRLNTYFEKYRQRWTMTKTVELLRELPASMTAEEREDAELKLRATEKKQLRKSVRFWDVQLGQRKNILEYLALEAVEHRVESMETGYDHLVPLKNCKAIDLFTWEEVDMKPEHHFTSCLNADLIPLTDDRCDAFLEWQGQVCCRDDEYLEWKLRVFGVSMTLFKFDRSFYMPLGPLGRNGKSSEAFLLGQLMTNTAPFRGTQISREYLSKQAQDGKSAAAPDTELLNMAHKTYLVVDECRDTMIDGALIKTLVSGDRSHARALYSNELNPVDNKGSLWLIANKTLKLDYSDPALMTRIRIMPYNAEWVDDPVQTRKKLSLAKASHVHQSVGSFKEDSLVHWRDAMATVCLHALHLYFCSLPKAHGSKTVPMHLTGFPVPKAVQQFTKATIEMQQPLLAFLNAYIGTCKNGETMVPVTVAFKNFRAFAHNENNTNMMKQSRVGFESDLKKHHINVLVLNGENVLDGHYLKKEVEVEKSGRDNGWTDADIPGPPDPTKPTVEWFKSPSKRPREVIFKYIYILVFLLYYYLYISGIFPPFTYNIHFTLHSRHSRESLECLECSVYITVGEGGGINSAGIISKYGLAVG